jgi:hypothetical protein
MATAKFQSNLFQNIFSANEFRISIKGEFFESVRQHNEDHMVLEYLWILSQEHLALSIPDCNQHIFAKERDQIDDAERLKRLGV